MRRLRSLLVPALLALTPSAALATPRLGFDPHDARCTTTRGIFRIAWTETAFSRNRVQGADGRCSSVPAYVERSARDLAAAAAFGRGAGFVGPLLVRGRQHVAVLDVRGPTGAYGFTAGDAGGTATIYLDTFLLRTESRALAARTVAYAIWNRAAPDVFHRLPGWVVQGTAGWFQAGMGTAAQAGLTLDLAALATARTGTPITAPALAHAAVGFWRDVATGPRGGAVIRAALATGRGRRSTTTRLIAALRSATAGALPALVGTYALDLADGASVGGIPVPQGWAYRRRPRLDAGAAYSAPTRTETLSPLAVALVPVRFADPAAAHVITVDAPGAASAALLAPSCAVLVGGVPVPPSVAGGRLTWTIPAGTAATGTTLVLASTATARLPLHVGAATAG